MIDYNEIAVLDRNALFLGVPTFELMEHAGTGVAKVVREHLDIAGRSVVIFCGLGNNGGDGLVAGRVLAEDPDCTVRLVLLGEPSKIRSTIASEQFYRLPKAVEIITVENNGENVINELDISNDSVVIDAMLGVGITGALKEPYKSAVRLINSRIRTRGSKKAGKKSTPKSHGGTKPLIVAVDVPTGLGTETVIKPDITVTFHDSKTGMTTKNSGKIIIHDIGIPEKAGKFVGPGELTLIPKLKKDSHKGDHGRLLIIGGGPYTGAPALVGLSALRTGVDLVHFAIPHKISNLIAGFSPNFIAHPLTQSSEVLTVKDVKGIIELLDEISADALVIGPGLGAAAETKDAVGKIIMELPNNKPIVLDADGLTALAKPRKIDFIKLLKNHTGVLTPHKGEFQSIISNPRVAKKLKIPKQKKHKHLQLQDFAKQFANAIGPNWTVLLKGNIDIISNGKDIKLNRSGNPGMTVGGTGDVLAGISGALLAMGLKPFSAARTAAFINGYSGDLAWEKYRNGLMATDIIEFIPQCFKDSLG